MRFSCYEWNPKRFHPQFSGIAVRYSSQKKERLSHQRRRKELNSDYAYTLNIDHTFDLSLQKRTLQLSKLQQARERHLDEMRLKQQQYQQRRQQISSLRERNNHNRMQTKRNIEMARTNLLIRNEESRAKIKRSLSNMNAKLEHSLQQKHDLNHLKYREGRENQQRSQAKVNNFYRERNQRTVQQYLQRIKEESQLKREEQRRIRLYEKHIKIMNKTTEMKKVYLNEVQNEILKLRKGVKMLKDGSKIRTKVVKLTEESEDEKNRPDWQNNLRLVNPQERSDQV